MAKEANKEHDFFSSVAVNVWSRGVDAGTDHGLRVIAADAGLNWSEVESALDNAQVEQQWRSITAANEMYLKERGYWGVPCLKYGDVLVWGQDKLWMIEEVLEEEMCRACGQCTAVNQCCHHLADTIRVTWSCAQMSK